MKPRNLLIASVLLVGLAGLVYWAQRHPNSSTTTDTNTPPSPKLADIRDSSIQQVDITKKDTATVTLQRAGGKWVISAPQQLPADQDAVSTLLGTFSSMTGDSVVEDKASNLAQYGLTTPSLDVKVHEKSGKTDEFAFGNDAPAGSLTYASLGSSKVYAVGSSTKTSLDKGLNDLRDKRLLTFDTGKLTSVQVASPKGSMEFAKNNQGDWQIVKPQPYRADSFQVEELIRKLGDAKMDLSGSADDLKKAQAAFASGTAVATAKVTDASGTQTLQLGKNKDGYFAHGSNVAGSYKVSNDVGTQLEKPVEDYRNKKLFDFGFSDPTTISIQQNNGSATYTHSGTDWKANGKTLDPGGVQSFIDKLREISATKFSTAAFPGAAVTIMVTSNITSDKGKRVEKVDLAKSGTVYLALRENEPTVYEVDASTVDDLLKANSAIKPAKK